MADSRSSPSRGPQSPDRRAELAETGPADDLPEAGVGLAAQIRGTPVSAVGLVDRDHRWLSAIHGLQVDETPRKTAFCAHRILAEVPLVVPDALCDQYFAWNPLAPKAHE